MGKVVAGATVSLDGYIAGPNESGFEHLFAWFAGGDCELPSANPDVQFHLTEPDYPYLRDVNEDIGVHVIGRRLFDLTDGWSGRHPFDKPIVVVTHSVPQPWVAAHPDAPFTFVTDGLPSAIERARAMAGGLNVSVTAGKIASQCLELGPARRDLDRPRAGAARLRGAVPRRAEGSADPRRWARPARRGVSRNPPAVPGPSLLRRRDPLTSHDGACVTSSSGGGPGRSSRGTRRTADGREQYAVASEGKVLTAGMR